MLNMINHLLRNKKLKAVITMELRRLEHKLRTNQSLSTIEYEYIQKIYFEHKWFKINN
jgi:hypothetical protein